ncbi:MAG: hypothetical protein EOO53_17185 [Gammaproteobacteria bacterium]|nr:MAG: hypothetical protein EOO53_17185 [Gammaproteobacteria bacterium]
MSISKAVLIFVALLGAQLANANSGNLGVIKHNPPDDNTMNQSIPPDPYGEIRYTLAAAVPPDPYGVVNGQSVPPDPYGVVNGQSVPPDPYGVLNAQAIIKHNPPGDSPVLAGIIFHNPPTC